MLMYRSNNPGPLEFRCPGLKEEDGYPFVTIDYCEGKGMGKGCKEKDTCIPYLRMKELIGGRK